MTKVDRLCVKVALWPVAIFIAGLLGFMTLRDISGGSPLPDGFARYIPGASVLVTFSAILTANLLQIRLGCLRS